MSGGKRNITLRKFIWNCRNVPSAYGRIAIKNLIFLAVIDFLGIFINKWSILFNAENFPEFLQNILMIYIFLLIFKLVIIGLYKSALHSLRIYFIADILSFIFGYTTYISFIIILLIIIFFNPAIIIVIPILIIICIIILIIQFSYYEVRKEFINLKKLRERCQESPINDYCTVNDCELKV